MDKQHSQTELAQAVEAYRGFAYEKHADNPALAGRMLASFQRFAQYVVDTVAEDPDAKFAIVESQSLAAHERPTQQHYNQLKANGLNVVNLTAEKGVDFARQHFMPNAYEAGPDYLADRAKQDELLRVRAQQDNDAFCEKLYPTFAKEQALAMVPGAEKYVEFLGSRLEVIGGDVSSGTAALLHEKYGAQFGIKRFAIDNGLGPGYEEYPEETNKALNEARRELGMPEQPVEGISATCSGEGGVLTPFVPGVLYKNDGQDLNLHGFKYVDPERVGDSRIEEAGIFPGKGERPIFYGTGTSSGGQSEEIAPLLHDHNMAMIRAFQRVAQERGAQALIAVGKGKIGEYAHLEGEEGITIVTEGGTPGFQGAEAGVTIVEFGPQIPAYREISENIRDGKGGGVVSHGGAGTIKEATSDKLAAPMEVMGFPTFADQQYNIRAMADRGVFLEVQGDSVAEWTQSIYDNAIEMLDNPGARNDAIVELRAELDAQPPLGEVYRGFLGPDGPADPGADLSGPLPDGPDTITGPGGGAAAPEDHGDADASHGAESGQTGTDDAGNQPEAHAAAGAASSEASTTAGTESASASQPAGSESAASTETAGDAASASAGSSESASATGADGSASPESSSGADASTSAASSESGSTGAADASASAAPSESGSTGSADASASSASSESGSTGAADTSASTSSSEDASNTGADSSVPAGSSESASAGSSESASTSGADASDSAGGAGASASTAASDSASTTGADASDSAGGADAAASTAASDSASTTGADASDSAGGADAAASTAAGESSATAGADASDSTGGADASASTAPAEPATVATADAVPAGASTEPADGGADASGTADGADAADTGTAAASGSEADAAAADADGAETGSDTATTQDAVREGVATTTTATAETEVVDAEPAAPQEPGEAVVAEPASPEAADVEAVRTEATEIAGPAPLGEPGDAAPAKPDEPATARPEESAVVKPQEPAPTRPMLPDAIADAPYAEPVEEPARPARPRSAAELLRQLLETGEGELPSWLAHELAEFRAGDRWDVYDAGPADLAPPSPEATFVSLPRRDKDAASVSEPDAGPATAPVEDSGEPEAPGGESAGENATEGPDDEPQDLELASHDDVEAWVGDMGTVVDLIERAAEDPSDPRAGWELERLRVTEWFSRSEDGILKELADLQREAREKDPGSDPTATPAEPDEELADSGPATADEASAEVADEGRWTPSPEFLAELRRQMDAEPMPAGNYELLEHDPTWVELASSGEEPEPTGEVPEQIGEQPDRIGEQPDQIGEQPERISETPEAIGATPERISETPQRISEVPERISEAPEPIGEDALMDELFDGETLNRGGLRRMQRPAERDGADGPAALPAPDAPELDRPAQPADRRKPWLDLS